MIAVKVELPRERTYRVALGVKLVLSGGNARDDTVIVNGGGVVAVNIDLEALVTGVHDLQVVVTHGCKGKFDLLRLERRRTSREKDSQTKTRK